MRLIIQAVEQAEVLIHDTHETNSIKNGILIYFGVHKDDIVDYQSKITKIVDKIGSMRWLKDHNNRLDATLYDIHGQIMVISNFTLYAHNNKGNKMSFSDSAPAMEAVVVYDLFIETLRHTGLVVQTGKFGALMEVSAKTLGPINYVWDV